jgi:hypothetical protein
LVLAAPAAADTYCVNFSGGCDSVHTKPTIADAFAAASSGDLVRVGSGMYTEGPLVQPAGVRLLGSATDDTGIPTLTTSSDNVSVLTVSAPPAGGVPAVNNVRFLLGGTNRTGLSLPAGGSADSVRVDPGLGATQSTGVRIAGGAGSQTEALTNARVSVGQDGTAVAADGNGVDVEDSVLVGGRGLVQSSGTLTAQRLAVAAAQGVVLQTSSTLNATMDNSLVLVQDFAFGAADRYGVLTSTDGPGHRADVDLRNLTIVPPTNSAPGGAGVLAGANTSGTSVVTLHDSIVRGFPAPQLLDLGAQAFGGGHASLTVDHSDFRFANTQSVTRGPGNLDNVDPGFASTLNFHLAADSPLIDAGSTTPPADGETDLADQPRRVVGNSGCVLARDMGAFEYQSPATFAKASAPADATTGSPITFDASGSCGPDPSLGLMYGWAFDDDTSVAPNPSPTVQHAFATAGRHRAILLVVDAEGRTGRIGVTVNVNAPASASTVQTTTAPPAPPPLVTATPAPQPELKTPPMRMKDVVTVKGDDAIVKVTAPKTFNGVIVAPPLDVYDTSAYLKTSVRKTPKGKFAVTAARRSRSATVAARRFRIRAGQTRTIRMPLTRRGRTLVRAARGRGLRAQAIIRARLGSAAPRTTREGVTMSTRRTRKR